jgi:hypothetical protein
MQKTNTQQAASPARNSRRECCTDAPCDSGLRNRYFEGKPLTADSFAVEQSYALDRRRLLNQAIHGWGVVYGYAIEPAAAQDGQTKNPWGRLQIGPGLALDECGRELLQRRTMSLDFSDAILVDGKGVPYARPPEGSYQPRAAPVKEADDPPRACWLLSAHYAEQLVGPVKVSDPCSCKRDEWDHVCESVRFSLRLVDCEQCRDDVDCELACDCGTGASQAPKSPAKRGSCRCLCEYLTGLSDTQCGELLPLSEPWHRMSADLCHGVPLACVSLREGQCEGEWLFGRWIDACGPRRLVKSNDVLFDLIRGCDLTRISAIGWADWHRARTLVGWDGFEEAFGVLNESDLERMRKSRDKRDSFPVVTRNFWVEFSRQVRQDTVWADCFSMTVLRPEEEGGWTGTYRVPILKAETWAAPGTPAGLVSRATLVVDGRWLYDAIKGSKTIFDENPITVEIEVRGDLIVDCNGQTVDANGHGLSRVPSGNGTPGGTFFSSFQVQPRFVENRVADDSAERTEGVQP